LIRKKGAACATRRTAGPRSPAPFGLQLAAEIFRPLPLAFGVPFGCEALQVIAGRRLCPRCQLQARPSSLRRSCAPEQVRGPVSERPAQHLGHLYDGVEFARLALIRVIMSTFHAGSIPVRGSRLRVGPRFRPLRRLCGRQSVSRGGVLVRLIRGSGA
jgi:hypothetical protein